MRLLLAIFNAALFVVTVLTMVCGAVLIGTYCVPSDPLLGFLAVISFAIVVIIFYVCDD